MGIGSNSLNFYRFFCEFYAPRSSSSLTLWWLFCTAYLRSQFFYCGYSSRILLGFNVSSRWWEVLDDKYKLESDFQHLPKKLSSCLFVCSVVVLRRGDVCTECPYFYRCGFRWDGLFYLFVLLICVSHRQDCSWVEGLLDCAFLKCLFKECSIDSFIGVYYLFFFFV